jgi:hypothetical protein
VPISFRGFLERHAEVLRALPSWVVRLLVPCHKADAIPIYQAAFREQVVSPLRPAVLRICAGTFTRLDRRHEPA